MIITKSTDNSVLQLYLLAGVPTGEKQKDAAAPSPTVNIEITETEINRFLATVKDLLKNAESIFTTEHAPGKISPAPSAGDKNAQNIFTLLKLLKNQFPDQTLLIALSPDLALCSIFP